MPKNTTPGARRFISRRDFIIIAAAVVLCAVGLLFWLFRGAGSSARVSVGTGDDATHFEVSLSQSRIINIDAALPVQLEVKDGAIRFVNSVCPDHDCEGFGWLSREGDWALCAPAGVMVRVEKDGR